VVGLVWFGLSGEGMSICLNATADLGWAREVFPSFFYFLGWGERPVRCFGLVTLGHHDGGRCPFLHVSPRRHTRATSFNGMLSVASDMRRLWLARDIKAWLGFLFGGGPALDFSRMI